MSNIQLIDGDATKPIGIGIKLICHVANDINCWGSGMVMSISKRWSKPERHYHDVGNRGELFLGMNIIDEVEPDIFVVSMVAQEGIGMRSTIVYDKDGNKINKELPPIRYNALTNCLEQLKDDFKGVKFSVHMPYKMGADRARGDWNRIVHMVEDILCKNDIPVVVYKLKG